jgi:ribosomal protein L4
VRVREQKLIVLDAFNVENLPVPARKRGEGGQRLTKRIHDALAGLGTGKKVLVVDAGNELLARGTKNLPSAKWIAPEGLNVYDVLKYDTLIITAPSAKQVEDALRSS